MKLEIPETLIESTALADKNVKNALIVSLYQQGREIGEKIRFIFLTP